MKSVAILVAFLAIAGSANAGSVNGKQQTEASVTVTGGATAAAQTDGSQKAQRVDASGNVAPAGDTAAHASFVKVTDGTDTADVDSSGRMQCVVTDGSGALNVIVDSSALPSGAATETTQAAQGIGNYCTTVPLGVAFDPGASGTDVAATLTGICAGGTCKRLLIQNVSANPCMVQYNSSTGTAGVCVYGGTTTAPYEVDSSRWVSPSTGVTNLYATTTGTTSCPTGVTVGACNLHLVGCI